VRQCVYAAKSRYRRDCHAKCDYSHRRPAHHPGALPSFLGALPGFLAVPLGFLGARLAYLGALLRFLAAPLRFLGARLAYLGALLRFVGASLRFLIRCLLVRPFLTRHASSPVPWHDRLRHNA
jgi:hypothetical protein